MPVECDTANNVADIGTKALGPVPFSKHAAAVVGRVLPRKLVKAGDNGSTHHRVFMIKVTDNGEHRSSSSPSTEVSGAPRSDPSIFLRPDHGRCAHQEAGRAVVPELVCQDNVDVVRRAIRVVRLEVDELRRNVVGLSGEMHSRMGAGRQDLGELRLLVHAVRDEAALVRQATNTNEAAVRSTSNSLSICIAKMIEEFSQLSLWAIQVDASLDEARTLPLEVERARNECEQLDERMQFLDDSERFRSTRLCREVEEYRRDIVTMTARISEEKMETAASIRAVAASTEETVARYCRGTRTREVSAEDHVQELFDAAEGRWDAAQNRKLKFIHDQQACMKAAFQTEVVELKIMLDQQARGFQIQMQAQVTAFYDALHAQAKENQEKWDIFRA